MNTLPTPSDVSMYEILRGHTILRVLASPRISGEFGPVWDARTSTTRAVGFGAEQACWMALPKERRNVEEVAKEIRRIVERALANFREDAASFGRAREG